MNDHRRIQVARDNDALLERRAASEPDRETPARPVELWLVFIIVAVSWFAAGAVWMDTLN